MRHLVKKKRASRSFYRYLFSRYLYLNYAFWGRINGEILRATYVSIGSASGRSFRTSSEIPATSFPYSRSGEKIT